MSYTSKADVVKAAMAVAEDVTAGQVQVSDIESEVIAKCRELFAVVYGPEDPLWELHRDVVRQFLSMGGMPADELAEWLAVQRQREGAKPAQSWIERALADGADDDGPTE